MLPKSYVLWFRLLAALFVAYIGLAHVPDIVLWLDGLYMRVLGYHMWDVARGLLLVYGWIFTMILSAYVMFSGFVEGLFDIE